MRSGGGGCGGEGGGGRTDRRSAGGDVELSGAMLRGREGGTGGVQEGGVGLREGEEGVKEGELRGVRKRGRQRRGCCWMRPLVPGGSGVPCRRLTF